MNLMEVEYFAKTTVMFITLAKQGCSFTHFYYFFTVKP